MSLDQNEFQLLMEALKDIKKDTEKLTNCMFIGNGKPAMTTRVDRLEICEARRSRFSWVIISALVGVMVVSAWGVVTSYNARAENQQRSLEAKHSRQDIKDDIQDLQPRAVEAYKNRK